MFAIGTILKILTTVLGMAPSVISMVKNIEGVIEGAKKGEIKKKLVLETVSKGFDAAEEIHPGISDIKAPVLSATDKLVDATVTVFNTFGIFRKEIELDVSPKQK
jgi:hypothetical protein